MHLVSRIRIVLNRFVLKRLHFPTPFCLVGTGAAANLCNHLAASGIKRVMVVSDKGLLQTGLVEPLLTQLREQQLMVTLFSDVLPDPDHLLVTAGAEQLASCQAQAVLAIGGGSVIDCAKAIIHTHANQQDPRKLAGLWLYAWPRKRGVPLYAIPTTAGTGSEVTIAAVVSDKAAQLKLPIIDPKLLPKMVALDASLTLGLPAALTGHTGMDALTHAVEAFISAMAFAETDQLARTATKLILQHLPLAVADGQNSEARQNMLYASCLAGMAFTRAGVGYVHAFAHQLGARYHIPHGLANAMLLVPVLELMQPACNKKLAILAVDSGLAQETDSDETKASQFIQHLKMLRQQLAIPLRIEQLRAEDIDAIISRAFAEAHGTYGVPRYLDRETARHMLTQLL